MSEEPLKKDKIIPEYVTSKPHHDLTVTYPNDLRIEPGQALVSSQTKQQPLVEWTGADPGKLYTLLMVDPDAPWISWPFLGEIVHWLVINIRGGDLSTGQVACEHGPPGPPPLAAAHRYVFIVYEQQGEDKLQLKEKWTSRSDRMRFSTRKFTESYNLNGRVHCVNYFKAKRG